MNINKTLFQPYRLGAMDYIIGGILLLFCFFAFFQGDIFATGWNSLNYLYGKPLEFYENCKNIQGHGVQAFASYPPSIFAIFALWLYPFKLLGIIKSPFYFPVYLVYWLKVLTSLIYVATGLLFYRLTQIYYENKIWNIYATWIWLTSPLAIFSQFIFSQYDIFYVFLTLSGFFYFLEKKIFFASFIFGLAITFKYFPFFVFIPLLLFFEKNIIKLALCSVIFALPVLLIYELYQHSPAFISGVIGFSAVGRVFSSFLEISSQRIYFIFAGFTILSGISYCLDRLENYKEVSAYIFLFSSIFSFLFIAWHPQWLIFITMAVALTTVISDPNKIYQYLLIDLLALFVFIAYVVLTFQDNVDLNMLQVKLFHIPFQNSPNMASLFKLFKGFSANVYLSVFWGYLLLQFFIKYKIIFKINSYESNLYPYSQIRIRYYVGILAFLIPATIIFFINYKDIGSYVIHQEREIKFGELISGRKFEQSFVAKEPILKQVDLFLSTFSRFNRKDIQLQVFNSDHIQLALIKRSAIELLDNGWESFKFTGVNLQKNETYLIRLSSPESVPGDAITWWATGKPYANAFAIVDGVRQHACFTFRLKFAKQ